MSSNVIAQLNQLAKQDLVKNENGPFMTCNWVDFVFIHYEVDKNVLQEEIPFTLDLYNNKAYVSLVAFTLEKFRFAKGGKLTQWIMAPVSTHRYFNVRTYVRHNVRTYVRHKDKDGIYFIKEWISNRLCALIGSHLYGLPCQNGKLNYQHHYNLGQFKGEVIAKNVSGQYSYQMRAEPSKTLEYVQKDSLDEFLLERYTAFVKGAKQRKYFRIWHNPWRQNTIDMDTIQDDLMVKIGLWGRTLRFVKAHYSPGVYEVWMGKPQNVR